MLYPLLFLLFTIPCLRSMSQPRKDSSETQQEYTVEEGTILTVSDGEITLLINSTDNVTVEEQILGLNETDTIDLNAENGTEIEPEPIKKEGPTESLIFKKPHSSIRFRKVRPQQPEACRVYSSAEKYKMLERVGSRNQMYMADSVEEASRSFITILPIYDKRQADAVEPEQGDDPTCDYRCEQMKKVLEQAVAKKAARPLNDAGTAEIDEGFGIARGCVLDVFVPFGNCTEPGEEASWTHEHLCSECRGIFMLNDGCFPTFFNTVRCNRLELGCIFDNFSNKAHGECYSQTLGFKVLRNVGTTSCENWVTEDIELPVSCQCMLSKSSWLKSRSITEL